MTDVARRLIDGYESELGLYMSLLALAREEHSGAGGARSVERTLARLREKGRILEEIGRLEAGLAPLKESWDQERGSRPNEEISALNRVLEQIAQVLEETLGLEGSVLRRFALSQGLASKAPPLVPASHAARYGEESTGDACVSVRG